MVKLATARECRLYGSGLTRNRFEYINAGLYVFATLILLCGFVAQLSSVIAKSGLVVLLIGLVLILVVNIHDLFAHMAGIDYRLQYLGFDTQLALVEFAVPIVQALGSLVFFLGVLFFFIEEEKRHSYSRFEKHALSLLIAGPVLWVVGSIHNSCQIYERSDGHVQIMQASVYVPFLMGSLLLVVGAILNKHSIDGVGSVHSGLSYLRESWIWLGIFGSLFLFVGGLTNVAKVFKMQQMEGVRLEKLRGGAQERLNRDREGQVPLILEDQRRRKIQTEEATQPPVVQTSYKDALVSRSEV
ncbi:hypothetical protein C5167_027417 [Papaver somniferum]|uniref:uncharacterized protein LOC113339329 n=1 Tax=Papaver somniferum TaxID=3469 RepID=UPI000E7026B5|nr:uncharacterized protein LOC113339329 [Papaver somniferum]RZC91357.1 hypothetical protein C5167_027417 [Papaver somniferum]